MFKKFILTPSLSFIRKPYPTPALKMRLKKIITLALPSGANSLLDILVIGITLFFMGKLGDLYIVGLGVSLNYFMLFFAVNAIFFMGTNAQISRYFGARNLALAQEVFSSLITFGFLISLPMILVGKELAEIFFDFIGITQEAKALAMSYSSYLILTIPALMLKNIILAGLAAISNTWLPLLVRVFVVLFCILTNYILIFGSQIIKIPALGIEGAGLATFLTAYVELCALLILVWKKSPLLGHFIIKLSYLLKTLKIGIPAGIERFLTLFSIILTTKFITHFGDLALAGTQIGTRIEAFSFMPGFGFMVASMVLMGQSLGARKIKAAALYVRTILLFSSTTLGFFGILLVVFSRNFSMIFSNEEEVIKVSIYYLLAVGLSQVPLICSFVLDGALRGAGATNTTLAVNCFSIWIFRILPMALIVKFNLDIQHLFLVIFIETYIRAILFFLVFKKGIWKRPGTEL